MPSTGRDEAFAPTPQPPVLNPDTNASSLRMRHPFYEMYHHSIQRLQDMKCDRGLKCHRRVGMKHLHQHPGHQSYILIQMLHPYGCVTHFTGCIIASSNGFRHEMRSRVEVPSTGRDEAFAPTPRPPVRHPDTNASSLRDVSPLLRDVSSHRLTVLRMKCDRIFHHIIRYLDELPGCN